jgi:predicted GNAT family N-acyltransferase
MGADEFSFEGLQITNSAFTDIDFIFRLFDNAIQYQEKNGHELWPQFSKQLIETEIAEKRHWKILNGETTACVFSVLYSDPIIWEEKNNEPSVYLHRIAINPSFKGRGVMNKIKIWAIQHAREKAGKYVRMDTWGNNENLRRYYISCGFSYIGQQYLKNVDGLPAHYGGSVLNLFQIEVK